MTGPRLILKGEIMKKGIVKKVVVERWISGKYFYFYTLVGHNGKKIAGSRPLRRRNCLKAARRLADQLGVKVEVRE